MGKSRQYERTNRDGNSRKKKMLENKNTTTEMKNAFHGLTNKQNTTE